MQQIAEFTGTGVLLVGETGNPTASGMVVNFTIESGSVRFEIDAAAATRQRITLSSKLLSLAVRVKK